MWLIEYNEEEGKYWFRDKNGKIRKYSSYNRAKLWRAKLIVVQEQAIAALYYNANGNNFGQTIYEKLYANDEQAASKLSKSGAKTVLREMMHNFSAGDDSKFDAVVDLNSWPTGLTEAWGENYSLVSVLRTAGMKIVKVGKWIGNKYEYRIVRDSDASEANAATYNTIFNIADEQGEN